MRNRLLSLAVIIALWPCALFQGATVHGVTVHGVTVQGVTVQGVTRLAVLVTGGAGASTDHLAALVESKLGAINGIQLLDRESLPAVLGEQQLQACFSPAHGTDRVKLGELLQTDLLVMLRPVLQPVKHIDMVICESITGLRLLVEPLPATNNLQTDAAVLVDHIVATVNRSKHPIRSVVAVPPLVCDDVSFDYSRDGAAYARVIEQSLLGQPGVVVVELDEARGIATELAVGGLRKAQRPAPLLLLGSYRSSGIGPTRRVRVNLQLKRGDTLLSEAGSDDLPAISVPEKLLWLVHQLLTSSINLAPSRPDAELDARQLRARGSLFLRLGQPDEALGLSEASLLLMDVPDAHADAAWAIMHIWSRERDRLAPLVQGMRRVTDDARAWQQSLPLLRSGLAHVEIYLSNRSVRRPVDVVAMSYLSAFPPDEASDMLLRVMQRKYQSQIDDDTFELAGDIQWRKLPNPTERYARLTSLAALIARSRSATRITACAYWLLDQGENSPPLHESLAKLSESSNPLAHKVGIELTDRLNGGLNLIGESPLTTHATTRPLEGITAHGAVPKPGAVTVTDAAAVRMLPLALVSPLVSQLVSPLLAELEGCIPAGAGLDVFWRRDDLAHQRTPFVVYLLKGNEPPRRLARVPDRAVPAFDGRYVWIARQREIGAELLIVDPRTGEEKTMTAADGLPTERITAFIAAPIAPGKICAAASVEHEGSMRTWIGLISMDLVKGPTFTLLHVARLNLQGSHKANDPDVPFIPLSANCLRPVRDTAGKNPACVVQFGGGNRLFSFTFPDATAVESGNGVSLSVGPFAERLAIRDQSWDGTDRERFWISAGNDDPFGKLWHSEPGIDPWAVGDAPVGALAVTDAGLYVSSWTDRALFFSKAPGEPFERRPTLLPAGLMVGRGVWWRSNHFGMVLVVGHQAYRFEDARGNGLSWVGK